MPLITQSEASRYLGKDTSTIINSKKYARYRHKDGHAMMFDLQGFQSDNRREEWIVAQITLLIQYLIHEEKIAIEKIAKVARCGVHSIHTLSFGFKLGFRIGRNIQRNYPTWIMRYEEYYR